MSSTRGRRRRAGFILLFGTRAIISTDRSVEPVRTQCPRCNQEADLVGKSYRQWFTLFFVPIVPVSPARRFTQCTNCGAQFPVTPAELRTRLSAGEKEQSQQAISLYNSLRASPANAITLDQLMKLYATLKEYDQAVSAAADFPQALQASEQCMTTLGRVYLAQNNFDEAAKWFDAATTRNPQLGEAHYYRALSALLRTPPDTGQAVASARAARNAGYPNADALLREAETKARGE